MYFPRFVAVGSWNRQDDNLWNQADPEMITLVCAFLGLYRKIQIDLIRLRREKPKRALKNLNFQIRILGLIYQGTNFAERCGVQ